MREVRMRKVRMREDAWNEVAAWDRRWKAETGQEPGR